MPYLHIPTLGNSREHPRLGVPTFLGFTISDVPPSAAEFFKAAGVLKATLTAAQATSSIVAEITALTAEVGAVRASSERPIADAGRFVTEAAKLADLPILGTERSTILGFAAMVAAALESIAINSGTTSPVTFIKSIRSMVHGLDGKAIDAAIQSFDRELGLHEAATTKLRQAHEKLLALAALADDGVAHEKVSALKASLDFRRRLPVALEALEAGRAQVAAGMERIELALTSLRECAA